jgi:glutamate formiminotransferase/formiminotetrahydrofolate cyclodeaminase
MADPIKKLRILRENMDPELLKLVDEDTNAFTKIMNAFGLPKATDDEKQLRTQAIQEATKYAIEIPFRVMQLSFQSMEIIKAMAEIGNPNSASDAGVGALCARSAIMGAYLNVKINSKDLADKTYVEKVISEGAIIEKKAQEMEKEIIALVEKKIKS